MLRLAMAADFVALRDLERAASLAGLGHIFPPQIYPYPDDRVLARWRLLLDDPTVEVLVDDAAGVLRALAAYDDLWLRHLAVAPEHWATGLATILVETALRRLAERGTAEAWLWVLAENHRARRFYERTGWVQTGDERTAEFVPHPREVSYVRKLVQT